MAFESWDDAMFWHGSLIGYMAGVKSTCKDEDKQSLLLRMADTQAKLEFIESENAKLREMVRSVLVIRHDPVYKWLDAATAEICGKSFTEQAHELGVEEDE